MTKKPPLVWQVWLVKFSKTQTPPKSKNPWLGQPWLNQGHPSKQDQQWRLRLPKLFKVTSTAKQRKNWLVPCYHNPKNNISFWIVF